MPEGHLEGPAAQAAQVEGGVGPRRQDQDPEEAVALDEAHHPGLCTGCHAAEEAPALLALQFTLGSGEGEGSGEGPGSWGVRVRGFKGCSLWVGVCQGLGGSGSWGFRVFSWVQGCSLSTVWRTVLGVVGVDGFRVGGGVHSVWRRLFQEWSFTACLGAGTGEGTGVVVRKILRDSGVQSVIWARVCQCMV